MRILVVDDDRPVREALQRALALAGYEVEAVADGEAALARMAQAVPDAVVLDVGLPGVDGLEVCRRLRRLGNRVPILILTARDAVDDRIDGLDAGADDYMVKPIDLDELAARLRAIERRANGRADERRTYGALSIDAAAKIVTLRGEKVDLSGREYAVLMALVRRPGGIVSRAQLEESLYGWDTSAESNTVEVYIYNLRRKLGPSTIQNQRGLGYRLVAPAVP